MWCLARQYKLRRRGGLAVWSGRRGVDIRRREGIEDEGGGGVGVGEGEGQSDNNTSAWIRLPTMLVAELTVALVESGLLE